MKTLWKIREWMKGKKTYILAMPVLIHGLYGLMTGDMSIVEAFKHFTTNPYMQEIMGASTVMSMRAGMSK